MAFDIPHGKMLPVERVEMHLDPAPHPFESMHEAAIEAGWRAEKAANPALFDGRVVLLSQALYSEGTLSGRFHAVRYATLLHWRRHRPPEVGHSFAHAALVSSDGLLVAARMGPHTANAGLVYFAAGSFEPLDFTDGMIDADRNMAREVAEETGLDLGAAAPEKLLYAHASDYGIVIFRRFRFRRTAEELAHEIRAFIARQEQPEITEPVVISGPDRLPAGLVSHMKPMIRWHFAGG